MCIRVLLVEDEPSNAELVREMLGADMRNTFEFTDAWCLSDALAKLSGASFQAILLDLGLPDGDGLDVIRSVRAAAGETPILVLTGLSDAQMSAQVLGAGANDYLGKHEMTAERLERALRTITGHELEKAPVLES